MRCAVLITQMPDGAVLCAVLCGTVRYCAVLAVRCGRDEHLDGAGLDALIAVAGGNPPGTSNVSYAQAGLTPNALCQFPSHSLTHFLRSAQWRPHALCQWDGAGIIRSAACTASDRWVTPKRIDTVTRLQNGSHPPARADLSRLSPPSHSVPAARPAITPMPTFWGSQLIVSCSSFIPILDLLAGGS